MRGEMHNKLFFLSVRPARFLLPSSHPESKAQFEEVPAGAWQGTDKSDLDFVVRLIFSNDGVLRF